MLPNETIVQLDGRFTSALNEIYVLGKEFTHKKIFHKILRALTKKWDIKAVVLKDSKDFSTMIPNQLFQYLKAHEYDLEHREIVDEISNPT